MCGAFKDEKSNKEELTIVDYILEPFLEEDFEPIGWQDILAIVDTRLNDVTPIKFCNEEGFDLLSIQIIKVLPKCQEVLDETEGTQAIDSTILDEIPIQGTRVLKESSIHDVSREECEDHECRPMVAYYEALKKKKCLNGVKFL